MMMLSRIFRMLFGSLRRQLIVGVALVCVVFMTVLVADLTNKQSDFIRNREAEHVSSLAHALAVSSVLGLVSRDISGLQELVDAQSAFPELDYVILTDQTGLIMAHTDYARVGQRMTDLPAETAHATVSRNKKLIDEIRPIFLSTQHVGWVRIGIRQLEAENKLKEVLLRGLIYIVVAVLAASAMAWVMGTRLTRRLYAVKSVMDEVRCGNISERSSLTGSDEAADLSAGFDSMLDTLALQRDELALAFEKLRAGEERFRSMVDTIPVALYLSSGIEQKSEYINATMLKWFGYSAEEIPSVKEWWPLAFPDEEYRRTVSEEWNRRVRLALETRSPFEPMEVVVTCKDGSKKTISWGFITLEALNYAFGQDLTDLRNAEEEKLAIEQQFQEAQKLESLGVLAGGIAHDFNNILTVIICNCDLAQQRLQKPDELITEIQKAAERAAELCRQMLAYAGKAQFVQSNIKMAVLMSEMLAMLKATIPQNVAIKSEFSPDILLVKGDAGQLRQIVMNLIINASEAIGEAQGEIRISLTNAEITADQRESDQFGKPIAPGTYVCLEVADNGCGMDEETRRRIFEPFYTTKFTGRGLGMAAVLGIITSHKGALQFHSQPGQGSIFRIYLPAYADSAAEVIPPDSSAHWQGSGTVLLIDDEPQLLLVAKSLLNALGFDVLEAGNGREALELYHKNAAKISFVITDLGMPVMDGYELLRELKKNSPELPVVISSGYSDAAVTARIDLAAVAGFLSKPYRLDQLREVLRGVVEKTVSQQIA